MRTVLSMVLFFAVAATAVAQQDTTTLKLGWKHKSVGALNLTQVSFANWAAGGENAFAWTGSLEGKSTDEQVVTSWENAYKFAYGQAKLQSTGLRKTDDVLDIASVLTYTMGVYVNPYVSATLKTQFGTGFDYAAPEIPAVSKFWDPAYLQQSLGVGYQPLPELKTRVGAALRETFTSEFRTYANDPGTPVSEWIKTRVEGGLESITEADWKFAPHMVFLAKLELFSPFKTMDKIIVRADAGITAKVNEYITTGLSVSFINDWRVTPRTQSKQTLALGLSYALL